MRGEASGGRLQALPRGIVAGLGSGQLRAAGGGIGQLCPAGFGGLALGFGNAALLGQIGGAGGEFGAACLDPGLGRFGLVAGAQGRGDPGPRRTARRPSHSPPKNTTNPTAGSPAANATPRSFCNRSITFSRAPIRTR